MASRNGIGAGKGWHNSPNEINAAWCDILEFEIAYVCAGQVGRTFQDGKVIYDMSAISQHKPKYKATTPRGKLTDAKRAKKLTINPIAGPVEYAVVINDDKGKKKGSGTKIPKANQIEAYFKKALTDKLQALSGLQKGQPSNVMMSAGTSAHTDICYIVGTPGAITDWYSYHAKHDVGPGGRFIGISNPGGYSVFWNTQWDESQEDKAQNIEDAYKAWHTNYTAGGSVPRFVEEDDPAGPGRILSTEESQTYEDDGELPDGVIENPRYDTGSWKDIDAGYWIEKFNADEAWRASFINYMYARMVQLKALTIKSEFNGRDKGGAPESGRETLLSGPDAITISPWSVQPYKNERWDMTDKNTRAVAPQGSLTQVTIQCEMTTLVAGEKDQPGAEQTEWQDAFTIAFRQDPIKRSRLSVANDGAARTAMDARVTERVGEQIPRENLGDYWRDESIPEKITQTKGGTEVEIDNPRRAPEDLLARLESGSVEQGELTDLAGRLYDFVVPEGQMGWSLVTMPGKVKADDSRSEIEYYVYVSDISYDDAAADEAKKEQRMLNTVAGEKVDRAGQMGASSSNPDTIQSHYVPKGVMMKEHLRIAYNKCLRILLEELDPEMQADFMDLSFDEFIQLDPTPADLDESDNVNEARWLKLAGLLKG